MKNIPRSRKLSSLPAVLGVWLVLGSIGAIWADPNTFILAMALLGLTTVLALTNFFRYSGWLAASLGGLFFAAAQISLSGYTIHSLIPVVVTTIALLVAAVLGGLANQQLSGTNHQIERDRQLIEELRINDEKTGLVRFQYARQFLRAEITRSQRYNTDLSLLLMQIAYWEEMEKKQDATSIENVYTQLAGLLRGTIREVDTAYLHNGKMGAILPHTSQAGALAVAQRLVDQTSRQLRFNLHVGIAQFPHDATKDSELIKAAEAALQYATASDQPVVLFMHMSGALEQNASLLKMSGAGH
jgi:diguanylate cyclase (GGDEF)-like protein